MDMGKRIENIAMRALNYVETGPSSLTDAAIKVASEFALNPHEVENLCARMNHLYFKSAFVEDKLVQFDVATHKTVNEKVHDAMPRKEKVSHYVINCESDMLENVVIEKVAEEQEDIMDEGTRRKVSAEYMKAMRTVENDIDTNTYQFDGAKERLYNLIKTYVADGMSLDEIYEALLKSWGDENKNEIREIMDEIKANLSKDGVIKDEVPVDYKELNEYPDREPVDELKTAALAISDLNEERNILCFKQIKLAKECQELGEGKFAENRLKTFLTREAVAEFIVSNMEKDASIPAEYHAYRGAISGMSNKALDKTLQSGINAGFGGKGIRGIMSGMAKKTAPLLAVSAVFYAADKITNSIKRNRLKTELPDRYPELLKDVPPSEFNKIFESVVARAPGLLDQPYSLANQIAKYHAYGGIDTAALGDLSSMEESASKTKDRKAYRTAINTAIKSLTDLE